MPKKRKNAGTPQPWAEMLRRCWPRIHSVELHVRSNNRGAFTSVEGAAVTVPRPEDEDASEPLEGPEAAAGLAGDMYRRAWEHLDSTDEDCRRLYFQLAAYELRGGVLEQIAATAVGGALRKDGTVESEELDESTERERSRTREDWQWARIVERDKMIMRMAGQFPAIVEKVGELATATIDARSKVATAEREMRKDELDARVDLEQSRQAGEAFQAAVERFGPAATIWAQARYAESTRPADVEPHPDAVVEAARGVSRCADPATIVAIAGVLGWETVNDLQAVMALAFADAPDPAAVAAGWVAIAPALIAKQSELGPALPKEKAEALASAVMTLHSLCVS